MPLVSKNFSDIITFTRASTGTYFDSAGVLQSAAINTPRLDYNPATLEAQGLLIEEARTNSLRNNTMVGAVAGTPGTLPTNWSVDTPGLTTSVVGTGTQNGVTYIDVRLNGTTSAVYGNILFEPTNGIAATNNQTWVHSLWLSVVGGSTTNVSTVRHAFDLYSSVPGYLSTVVSNLVGVSATQTRYGAALTTNNASTAFVRPSLSLLWSNGATIDITLRIGLPQLEQGAFATSVIPTTTTALTRSADVASVNTLSPWFNATEGSFVTEWVVSALGVDNNIASLSDGTTNNRHQNYVANTNAVLVRTAASGVASNNSNGTAVVNAIGKFAFGYGSGTTAASFNGSAVTTTTQALPSSISTLYLGQGAAGGGQKQIWLRRYTFYPRKLSNVELEAVST